MHLNYNCWYIKIIKINRYYCSIISLKRCKSIRSTQKSKLKIIILAVIRSLALYYLQTSLDLLHHLDATTHTLTFKQAEPAETHPCLHCVWRYQDTLYAVVVQTVDQATIVTQLSILGAYCLEVADGCSDGLVEFAFDLFAVIVD